MTESQKMFVRMEGRNSAFNAHTGGMPYANHPEAQLIWREGRREKLAELAAANSKESCLEN